MISIARTDTSLIGRWWWTIDRWLLGAVMLLVVAGLALVTAASPSVAQRIGLPPFHFVVRHLVYLGPALFLMVGISMLDMRNIRRLTLLMLGGALVLMLATLIFGDETKGATRWIRIFGFSLQPSEFMKPAFAMTAAWLLAEARQRTNFPGFKAALVIYGVIVALLVAQPDMGMTALVTAILGAQLFLAGLKLSLVAGLGAVAVGGLALAYVVFPHFTSRIDRFLDPASGDTYQVDRSIEAFVNGGFFGTGPGQGSIKLSLPDAHADFIFAVAGEEFGMIAALGIVMIYVFILLRGFGRALKAEDLFTVLAVGGLLVQFGLQAIIHMGSSLHLLPAKGMTLPFISYGGSSLIAIGITMGLVLALTRRQSGGWRGDLDRTTRARNVRATLTTESAR